MYSELEFLMLKYDYWLYINKLHTFYLGKKRIFNYDKQHCVIQRFF